MACSRVAICEYHTEFISALLMFYWCDVGGVGGGGHPPPPAGGCVDGGFFLRSAFNAEMAVTEPNNTLAVT